MARLVDGYAGLVWRWTEVAWSEPCLYARYEVGLLWHGSPVLNPQIAGPWPRRPGWDASFYKTQPGFLAGADHDAWLLTTFRKALTTSEPTE